ncbi:MAG: hypothetical protein ACJ8DI_09565 [Ktedonobacteraceae bacterium]
MSNASSYQPEVDPRESGSKTEGAAVGSRGQSIRRFIKERHQVNERWYVPG